MVPLVLAAAATGGGTDLVVGTIASATLAVVAYTGAVLRAGARAPRALVWGLLYILIWEGFVATAADTAARLAVRSYTRSVLSGHREVPLRAPSSPRPALVVPLAVGRSPWSTPAGGCARQDVA